MKKVLTKVIALSSVGLLMLSACKKNEAVVTSNGGKAGTLNATATTLVLDKTKLADASAVINFSFTTADYGYKAAVTNTLQIDADGDNWAKPMSVSLGNKVLAMGYSTSDFNALLLKLNLPAGVASKVNVRIAHSISAAITPAYSNVLSLTVTPFNLTSWLYITGAFAGWQNPGPMEDSLVSVTGNGIYTGIINFNATGNGYNEFLILPAKNWNHKYGTTETGTPTATIGFDAGNNIKAPATNGQYWVTANTNTGTISFAAANYYSVIGNAAQGWGTDVDLKYVNDGNGNWVVTTPLIVELPPNDGYKIRKNHDWGVSYGTPNPVDGDKLVTSNSLNIGSPTVGNFKITFWLDPTDISGNTAFWTSVKQ